MTHLANKTYAVFSQWQHRPDLMPDRLVVYFVSTLWDIYSGTYGGRVCWCCHIAASCHISPECCCWKDHNVTFPSCSRCFKALFCSMLHFALPQGISILRRGAIRPLKPPFSFFLFLFLRIWNFGYISGLYRKSERCNSLVWWKRPLKKTIFLNFGTWI